MWISSFVFNNLFPANYIKLSGRSNCTHISSCRILSLLGIVQLFMTKLNGPSDQSSTVLGVVLLDRLSNNIPQHLSLLNINLNNRFIGGWLVLILSWCWQVGFYLMNISAKGCAINRVMFILFGEIPMGFKLSIVDFRKL